MDVTVVKFPSSRFLEFGTISMNCENYSPRTRCELKCCDLQQKAAIATKRLKTVTIMLQLCDATGSLFISQWWCQVNLFSKKYYKQYWETRNLTLKYYQLLGIFNWFSPIDMQILMLVNWEYSVNWKEYAILETGANDYPWNKASDIYKEFLDVLFSWNSPGDD